MIIGLDFDIYVVFILIIEFDNDRLYLEKTPKTADGEIDWDLASDVTSYIQHNTLREIYTTRNKRRRTGPGTSNLVEQPQLTFNLRKRESKKTPEYFFTFVNQRAMCLMHLC